MKQWSLFKSIAILVCRLDFSFCVALMSSISSYY